MTGHGWMVDVLADLRAYAARNGMADLADRLAQTEAFAHEQVSSLPKGIGAGNVIVLGRDGEGPRPFSRRRGTGEKP